MKIKILGMGCPKCNRLEQRAREVAADLAVPASFTKVTDMDEILAHDVMITPALVIDDSLVSSGRLPTREEIASWIRAAESRHP